MTTPYYITKIQEYLPLRIKKAIWEQECFAISGKGWSFSTTTAWRVSSKNGFEYGSESDPKKEQLEELTGLDIITANPSGYANLDVQLILSNGLVIENFSTTHFEPWQLWLPDETIMVADGSAG